MQKLTLTLLVSFVIHCVLEKSALACSVCFGNKESTMVQGIGWGIFVLLGIVLGVFVLFGTFLFIFNKRSKIAG